MENIKLYLKKYKKALLPPYKQTDVPIVGVTLFLLASLIVVVLQLNENSNLRSNAATINTVEPEEGVLAGAAFVGTDTNASGGKFVQFGNVPPTNTPTPTLACLVSSPTFQNTSIPTQTGQFSFTFSATPNQGNMDGVIGLSQSAATSYLSMAATVRFGPSGVIQALKTSAYAADVSVPYTPGVLYGFRVVVNVPAHTYSVYVRPVGGTETVLATNYPFRTQQATVTSLGNIAYVSSVGSNTLCNPQISGVGTNPTATPTSVPTPTPTQGTTSGWVDTFTGTSVNTNFWVATNYEYTQGSIPNLHKGYFERTRATVGNGYLTLSLTQQTGTVGTNSQGVISRAGELQSLKTYGYGTYEWRMRASSTSQSPTSTTGNVTSGQISAGFLYYNNSQTELDFEVEGQYPNQLELSAWKNPDPTKSPALTDRDYSAANISGMANTFKTYKLVWSPTSVTYYVDNVLIANHTKFVPSASAYFMINHWGTNSTDFGGTATIGTSRYLHVDWVRYTPPGQTPIPVSN